MIQLWQANSWLVWKMQLLDQLISKKNNNRDDRILSAAYATVYIFENQV